MESAKDGLWAAGEQKLSTVFPSCVLHVTSGELSKDVPSGAVVTSLGEN